MKQPRAQCSIVALNLLLEDRTALTIIFSFLTFLAFPHFEAVIVSGKVASLLLFSSSLVSSACSNKLPPSFSCLLHYFQGASSSLFSSSLLSNIAGFLIILHIANILQKIILGLKAYFKWKVVPTLCSYSTHAS